MKTEKLTFEEIKRILAEKQKKIKESRHDKNCTFFGSSNK